jgi:uncharacterized protein
MGNGRPADDAAIRIAAAGDVHCRDSNAEEVRAAFGALEGAADLVLLAGDLTSHGTVEEARILAEAAGPLEMPVIAVLGNHDHHAGRQEQISTALREAGITVLDRDCATFQVSGTEVGVVGAKGFVGGFAPEHLPDFGERSLRDVYAETGEDVDALADCLARVATCQVRIVLLHYSPVAETLEGEPRGIHVFLGSDRLAAPILEHGPDLVLHGHAHAGSPEGRIGEVPVYNVSVPVIGADFRMFELEPSEPSGGPIR